MANVTPQNSARRRQIALLGALTALCAGAWGFNFWQQAREAPIRRHIEAGRRAIEQQKSAVAEVEWRSALQLDPHNSEALELLGDYYAAQQNWPQASRFFNQLAQLNPETPHIWSRLAVASAHLNDETSAARAVEEALRRDHNDADALSIQSTLLARQEKWEEQLACLRHLAQLQPENLDFAVRLADALTAVQKFAEARPLLSKIIAANPAFAPAYAMRAEGSLTPNAMPQELAQAENDLKKSLVLDAGQEKARVLLAQCYARSGKLPKAIEQYRELTNRHPGKTSYWNDLAGVYQKSGDVAQAIALRRRVAQIAQDRDRRDTLISRLANDPESFADNLQMGLLLLHSPAPLGTDKYIDKALSLHPRDANAKSAARELETLYQEHLQAGLKALRARDLKTSDREISRAMLLRPHDSRTTQAVQLVERAAAPAPVETP